MDIDSPSVVKPWAFERLPGSRFSRLARKGHVGMYVWTVCNAHVHAGRGVCLGGLVMCKMGISLFTAPLLLLG